MTCPPVSDWAGRLLPDTRYGSLTIDGVNMITSAWMVTSLAPLYDDPDVRGDDRLLPGVTGVRAYRRRATVTRASLPFLVTGFVDRFDAVVLNPYAQLDLNLLYLKTNVTLPTNTGNGTRTAVLTLPSGRTVTSDVHILGLVGDLDSGALWRGTIEISDKTGAFHA